MNQVSLNEISIRTRLQPGDLGYVMYRHGILYGKEYGYGLSFETYVGHGLYEFHKNYDPKLDGIWIAEHERSVVGFIFLMHREPGVAQLRYFLVEPGYRGIGLGKKLMGLLMEDLVRKQYTRAYLWTGDELKEAARMYTTHGFILTDEHISTGFGKTLKEQRYELIVKKN